MSCCPPAELVVDAGRNTARQELRLASSDLGGGLQQIHIAVPGVHCAGCIRAIETGLAKLPGIEQVRVNLSSKRVAVQWRGDVPPDLLAALDRLGFPGHLAGDDNDKADPELGQLIRALAVAGFCAMNIMLLSVSVWSGADASTRHVFHWISAGLALPCLVYSGRIFFASAWAALRNGRTNMNVSISIGLFLAFGLSLYDTIYAGPHAYFDAAVTLIFFLLIGRTLDHLMREKARSTVRGLVRLAPRGVTVLRDDGKCCNLPTDEIGPGMRIALAAGDRVPVDGVVEEGVSDLDCAIATGESAPQQVEPGSAVRAGTLNLSGPLTLRASVKAEQSFLSEMVRLMEAAEGGRARYRRLADRAARLYSPVVHATAFLTFLGWMAATGDWHRAITIAIAVLIITCPCALGLAVPMVQMVAARRLFDNRIMVKDGSALERMAEIDTVVFDKTGTLTLGRPRLIDVDTIPPRLFTIAGLLASRSNHPLSQTIAMAAPPAELSLSDVVEVPGLGIEAHVDGALYRLGRAGWAISGNVAVHEGSTVLARNGEVLAEFRFEDALRPGARDAVATLQRKELRLAMLSGDGPGEVVAVAHTLGIVEAASGLLPAEKVARLDALARDGRKVLMVGDGLNDAPALAAAHVSMAPASAADIGRNAADFVFLRNGLDAVPLAHEVSHAAGRLVRQNFALAAIYNVIAVPIAIAGYVTPLIAAFAMSLSSVLVVANALRLRGTPSMRTASAPASTPATEKKTASLLEAAQ